MGRCSALDFPRAAILVDNKRHDHGSIAFLSRLSKGKRGPDTGLFLAPMKFSRPFAPPRRGARTRPFCYKHRNPPGPYNA
mgnify:CR=1 FL=1